MLGRVPETLVGSEEVGKREQEAKQGASIKQSPTGVTLAQFHRALGPTDGGNWNIYIYTLAHISHFLKTVLGNFGVWGQE